jgi:hypothetical protein
LSAAGFEAIEVKPTERLTKAKILRNALPQDEPIFLVRK